MLDDNKLVKVKNRFDGNAGYEIPDDRISRTFAPGEVKEITMKELRNLSYQPGGTMLLKEYLCIEDPEAIKEILGVVEPEYAYNEKDIERVMLHGSLDEFLDMLDFSPEAVREIIKDLAVKLKLNDVDKREAIYNKTGFDVTRALENLKAEKEAEKAAGKEDAEVVTQRRAAVKPETSTEAAPARRIITPVIKQ